MEFVPDPEQEQVLEHTRGALLVTGPAGTGKTAVLRERFARLIEGGADPERVALVVGSAWARGQARSWLLGRLSASLPTLRVLTVHGLALHVVSQRYEALGYEEPPEILTAADQFAKVRELLTGEDAGNWPAYGSMLGLRGFADEVRQFLLRAQETLFSPDEVAQRGKTAGLTGWTELAAFYRRYLQVLTLEGRIDFAGLVERAAAAAEGPALFDHLVVDDYQDATFAGEALVVGLSAESLVVAGDPDAHVFSFQGTTDLPIRQFTEWVPRAAHVTLSTNHRGARAETRAWSSAHTSDEYAAVARELTRIHVEEDVPWSRMAVVVRRQGSHLGGLLRALDDRGVARFVPEQDLSAAAEPATYPFVLALRWLAGPEEREALVEPVLASELARVAPAAARGMVRAADLAGEPASKALEHDEELSLEERERVKALREALAEAERVADRSVLDAFAVLWRRLPFSARLVAQAERSQESRRDLDAIVAFSQAVARAGESADPSVQGFVARLQAGEEGPGERGPDALEPDAVHILTAHGAVGREFDSVVVVGALEGNFPSLARPEPMFDLAVLERKISQSDRNRLRLEDERRLFRMVLGRASRRVLLSASTATQEDPAFSARSRFAGEIGLAWTPAPEGPFDEPVTAAEAAVTWRRTLGDTAAPAGGRRAALEGLLALGVDPSMWWFQRDWTDTGRPLHDTIRVSYSRLDRLENCELQYVLSEELGLSKPAGYHAWVGHLVHGLIEQYEEGRIGGGLEGLVAEAERRWKPKEFPSFAVSEAFRRLVVGTMVPNWFRDYSDKPSLAREVRFEFEYDGATVTGYIDRIEPVTSGGTRIADYKTGKVRSGKPEENLQLGIYYLATGEVAELEPYRPVRGVELVYLRGKDERSGHVERVPWQWNGKSEPGYRQAIEERLAGLIERIRGQLQADVYRPNPAANCFFCEFRSLCPLWPEGGPVFPEIEPGQPVGTETPEVVP